MSGKIIILDEFTSNQIAAGEVVERPASVLKELIENSLDAGADRIEIEIKNGGIAYIKVSDNGKGIDQDDIPMALERHGTSKIRQISDLNNISTMGFRGEALPSIASVSNITITSKTADKEFAVKAVYEALQPISISKVSRSTGTTVEVKNLFFNTPARYKFLKGDVQETRYCIDIVLRLALTNVQTAFIMVSNNEEVIRTNGDNELINCIYGIYGRDIAKDIIRVDAKSDDFNVCGYIGKPFTSRGNRQHQSLYVNNRYVKYPELNVSIERAYETRIMKGKFPFYVLKLEIPAENVDVNVHPAKTEVKISNINEIFGKLNFIIKEALDKEQEVLVPSVIKPTFIKSDIKYEDKDAIISFNDQLFKFSKELHSIPNINETKTEYRQEKVVITRQKESINENTDVVDIEPYRIAGQILDTFIIVDKFDYIYIIDQHAAHEKIIFESLKEQYDKNNVISQQLMIPIEVVITSEEMLFVTQNSNLIKSIGFDYSDFGKNSILIREIPSTIDECDIKDVFNTILDDMMNDKKDRVYTALYSLACKAAVKANKKVDEKQMQYLYESLIKLKNPFTCPHGRPTMIKMTRYDMDKLFKRII
ncbi:MAG: DNA mismatch repair endonuclease MutL [Clostridia bacterium]|jgi:DNA mismatch repair protein MutL